MTRKERFQFIINYFQSVQPEPQTELQFADLYQLLVAVILSAQCTDKRVNLTTPALFQKYPDVKALSEATFEEVHPIIKSVSFANNKTRHLIGMAKLVMEKFGGNIPMTVEELTQLPGVGRKTAHVITSVADHQPNLAVDTHVFRVAERIGLTTGAKTPLATEKQLMPYLPPELVHKFHHWLVLHGRYVCIARKPKCAECGLRPACRFYQKKVKKAETI
ncbi:MAG: endonuclease III [Bacteroidota bacterium]|nr:endonuclease III [Flavisolibacter sp.]MBD0353411.1 endonuclease III [Flavisolibacter sp.]MDQ3843102.1 endonuclease III [Bacteroidota bacterium]